MALTTLQIKNLVCPDDKRQIKKSDGNGLYIWAMSNGSKLWRMKFKYAGKEGSLSFGQYPSVSLQEARKMTADARALLVQGINPAEERSSRKRVASEGERVFEVIALKWWEKQAVSWTEDHSKKMKRWITTEVKSISKLPIDVIDEAHLTEMMLSLESKGKRRITGDVLSALKRIFSYAIALRLTRRNPAKDIPLNDILEPMPKVEHRSAITSPEKLGQLIRDVDLADEGNYAFSTIESLRLIPRIFVRPKEVRLMKWEYIDFDRKLIEIPLDVMKKDRVHLVPLATQVVERLKYIQTITGYSEYVFPSDRNSDKPMSKNVMTTRLRKLGYGADVMSAHGFRASASTLLHEQGWSESVIETQLAHLIGSATSRAYNRSIYLAERKKMMQAWADQLDALRDGADVVPIGVRANAS